MMLSLGTSGTLFAVTEIPLMDPSGAVSIVGRQCLDCTSWGWSHYACQWLPCSLVTKGRETLMRQTNARLSATTDYVSVVTKRCLLEALLVLF